MSHQTIKHFDRKGDPQGIAIDSNGRIGVNVHDDPPVGVVLYDVLGNPILTDDESRLDTVTTLLDANGDPIETRDGRLKTEALNVDEAGRAYHTDSDVDLWTATRLVNLDGEKQNLHINPSGKFVVKASHDDAIDMGEVFFIKDFSRIAGADTEQTFVIQIPDTIFPADSVSIHLHWSVGAEAEYELRTYFEPTISDWGTEVATLNRNSNYLGINVPFTRWFRDCTFSDYGTLTYSDVIGSARKNDAGHAFQGEFILHKGSVWSMVFKKVASGTHWLSWEFNFSEDKTGPVIGWASTTTTTSTTSTTSTTTTYEGQPTNVTEGGDNVVHDGDNVFHTP